MSIYHDLHDYINSLIIFDSHEHLPLYCESDKNADILSEWLTCYFQSDLISAGLPKENLEFASNTHMSIIDRWDSLQPYWRYCENTGYGRALRIAARDLYGADHIGRDNIVELNQRFVEQNNESKYHEKLSRRGKIAVSVRDIVPEPYVDTDDPFVFAYRTDTLVYPSAWGGVWADMQKVAESAKAELNTMDDWMNITRISIERNIALDKVVCLKSATAYQRPIEYADVSRREAEQAFKRLYANEEMLCPAEMKKQEIVFSNWMMHFVCQIANEYHLTFQIHTGHQEGNEFFVRESNPLFLSNLFSEYPNVKFNIFHIGYPYAEEAGSLAKTFRNVYLDMCWAHVLCPELSQRVLAEWLGSVPANKINAFGGDYFFPDGVYGHQKIARENVARSLATEVERGFFSLSEAKKIADMVFFENAKSLYSLNDDFKKNKSV